MRKLYSIFLLSIVLLSQLGTQLFFTIQHWVIKEEQKQHLLNFLPSRLLVKFVDNGLLDWEEADREFVYQGNLYDVAKITTEHQVKIYWAVKDGKETDLLLDKIAALEHLHKTTSDKKQTNASAGWQFTLYPPVSSNTHLPLRSFTKHFKCWKLELSPQFISDLLVPPPQIA